MARHNLFTLDPRTAEHAATIRTSLTEGATVQFTVQGRDSNQVTERMGTVVGFSGAAGMSSEAVTVDTNKGPRTFNVWLIRTISVVGE